MSNQINEIVIVGAGSYGLALGERLASTGSNRVVFVSSKEEVVEEINNDHTSEKYYPGRKLNPKIRATTSFSCLTQAGVVFLAIPSYAIDAIVKKSSSYLGKSTLVVNLAKGISLDGGLLHQQLPVNRRASLKGPTFAIDMFNGLPSGLTFASAEVKYADMIKGVFNGTGISLDFSEDIQGVEYLSVLKNIYAIALGIIAGKYNSSNADFVLFTKAANEMRAFLEYAGSDPNIIFKYCGLGDLGLTSLNDLSRNRTLGLLIGKGFLGDDPKNSVVVEGVRAVKIFSEQVREWSVGSEFPVLLGLDSFLKGNSSVSNFIALAVK